MRPITLVLLLALVPALVSCTGFPISYDSPEAESAEKKLERIRDVISHASLQMRKKRFFYAQQLLLPYKEHPIVGREVRLMLREIEYQIEYRNVKKAKELSARNAINLKPFGIACND